MVEFDIIYGEGISKVGEVVDLGVALNVIQKAGSWFSYEGNKLAQGRDAVKALLQDNPELLDKLQGMIYAQIHHVPSHQAVAVDVDGEAHTN